MDLKPGATINSISSYLAARAPNTMAIRWEPCALSGKTFSPILRLPYDLLLPIFEHLPRSDLRSLCLVCYGLRPVAQGLIFSDIHLKWQKLSQPPPIALLVRTILARPDLAVDVQSLLLDGNRRSIAHQPGESDPRAWYTPRVVVDPAHVTDAITFVESTRAPFAHLWVEELRRGTIDAFVAILLCRSYNLRTLRLEADFGMNLHLTGLVIRSILGDPASLRLSETPFMHLQDVTIIPTDEPSSRRKGKELKLMPLNSSDLLPFFFLPEARHLWLAVENPAPDAFAWGVGNTPPLARNLTSLRLEFIREGHLGRILAATPALKTLHWTWFYRYDMNYARPQRPSGQWSMLECVELGRIVDEISTVKDTLVDLTLRATAAGISPDTDVSGMVLMPAIATWGDLGGLAKFSVLKRLDVPSLFLLRPYVVTGAKRIQDVMPRSLKSLTVSDDLSGSPVAMFDDDDLWEALYSYMADVGASTPDLEDLKLEFREAEEAWGPGKRDQLRALSRRAGVRLEVNSLPRAESVCADEDYLLSVEQSKG